ncbi:MAG: SUMF1/EgtB/PvdO family nonheme iron enzyme [Candidatus Omnitrophota bacterium]
MKKQHLFIVVVVVFLGLIFSVFQYYQALKTEDVSAVTVGTPNPGHSLSGLECSSDTLCIDVVGKKIGIGNNNPAYKLDVTGDVNITGQLYINGSALSSSSTCPTGWIDSGYGFCVMQYEARNVSGIATSTASGVPYVSVTQTQAAAACSALGSGSHLITNAEWMILARDIESVGSNWSSGTVGSGNLARGWAANTSYGDTWTNSAVAPSTGSSCLYNTAADTCGATGTFLYRRTHTLSNGQTVWDMSGNVYEWTHDICTAGTGTGYWYGTANWFEWTDSNLSDYEKITAGPIGAYTATNGAGRYYGCSANGNGFLRGGDWDYGSYAGLFNLRLSYAPSYSGTNIGFRCAR